MGLKWDKTYVFKCMLPFTRFYLSAWHLTVLGDFAIISDVLFIFIYFMEFRIIIKQWIFTEQTILWFFFSQIIIVYYFCLADILSQI